MKCGLLTMTLSYQQYTVYCITTSTQDSSTTIPYLVSEYEGVESKEQEGDHGEEGQVLDPGLLQHCGHWGSVAAGEIWV